ncbi:hypothetical protein M5K25_013312 [Dendrobium thyrsiflorum]|uniref:Uncharacterized protein n=1 Tax=Dendrobium thyrsiflorum TaxID=117978 RepID=A0ABD0UZF6_DENTH
MEGFLWRRDLPNMCRKAAKADDKELQLFTNFAASGMRSKGLIVNTSDSLEAPILSQIIPLPNHLCRRPPPRSRRINYLILCLCQSLGRGPLCPQLVGCPAIPLRRLCQLRQPSPADAGRVSGILARVGQQRPPLLVGGAA